MESSLAPKELQEATHWKHLFWLLALMKYWGLFWPPLFCHLLSFDKGFKMFPAFVDFSFYLSVLHKGRGYVGWNPVFNGYWRWLNSVQYCSKYFFFSSPCWDVHWLNASCEWWSFKHSVQGIPSILNFCRICWLWNNYSESVLLIYCMKA